MHQVWLQYGCSMAAVWLKYGCGTPKSCQIKYNSHPNQSKQLAQ